MVRGPKRGTQRGRGAGGDLVQDRLDPLPLFAAPRGGTAHSGRNSGEFRPPFAAPKMRPALFGARQPAAVTRSAESIGSGVRQAGAALSEPRAEQRLSAAAASGCGAGTVVAAPGQGSAQKTTCTASLASTGSLADDPGSGNECGNGGGGGGSRTRVRNGSPKRAYVRIRPLISALRSGPARKRNAQPG